MPPTGDPASPARADGPPRWRALLAVALVLTLLTVVGMVLLGERLFDLRFNP